MAGRNIQYCIFVLFFSFGYVVCGCHPECRDLCSDTICPALCVAITKPANCTIQCTNYTPPDGTCVELICTIRVNTTAGVCETDSCPIAETQCLPLNCSSLPMDVNCSVLCEEPQAGWYCQPPLFCPSICNMECDSAACAYQGSGAIKTFQLWSILLVMAIGTNTLLHM